MAQKTIQVADKPTLDYIKNKLSNFKIGGMSVVENDLECIMNDNYVNISVSTLPYDFTGSAVVYNNEIHILGGSSNKRAHYKWSGSSWTSVSTLPYDFNGSAVVCNNEIHILGGTGSQGKHYKWSGSGWTSVSTMSFSWDSFYAVVYNNEIHVFVSQSTSSEASYNARHYKWDGSEWTNASSLPFNFYGGDIVVCNNEIHMLGGYYGERKHYKWSGSGWKSVSTLPYSFYYGGAAVVYNNEIHILGGYEKSDRTKHYKWDGSSWTSVSTLPYDFTGSAVVYNNEIHILGGYENKTAHYTVNEAYKKAALYLLKNQKVYLNKDMSNVTALTNCTKETSNILVTENGLTEFKVDTTDYRVVLTIK